MKISKNLSHFCTCADSVNILILACASTCNVLFMRFHELYDGIEVIDEQNKPIGVSKVAAKKVIIIFKIYIQNINII
jgi:hypothetical protein